MEQGLEKPKLHQMTSRVVFLKWPIDLQNDEVSFRKFKLITEDIQGQNCPANFHGMDLTHKEMCSNVKKQLAMAQAKSTRPCDKYLKQRGLETWLKW
jgi:small subunit ribosomal protein S3Ae